MTIGNVMDQILADIDYYRQSGGGITLSGGEPVLQNQFCLELLMQLKRMHIHTIIQTAGNYEYTKLQDLLSYTDLIMYDIKAYSENIYNNHIYGDRKTIFNNLVKLDSENIPIIIRTPVVGSVNDTPEELSKIVKFIQGIKNLKYYALLPYHGLGKAKYDSLGKPYENNYYTPSSHVISKLESLVSEYVPLLK